MPSRAAQPARSGTLAGEAARRRAADVLRVGASACSYAAGRLADGLSPAEARQAALDVAGELELVAARLRRLARLDLGPAERRALAVELSASGMSQREVAEQVGVSKRTVWGYLRRGGH